MKLILQPDCLEVGQEHGFTAMHAGTSKDCQISWIFSAAYLEVFSSQTNELLASWRFGKVLKDADTIVTSVKDFKICGGYLLLVAVTNSSSLGQLCIFSVGLRKVLQVIEVPQRITALEILFSNTGDEIPKWILSKHLQFFCGLAAVGTDGGYVYLLDLCLDMIMQQQSTEDRPRKLMIISPGVVDSEAKRRQAFSYDKHIAVLLDGQCHIQGQYYYRRQDDSVQKTFDEDVVHVTCLKYLEQAGILAVGFNFGSFQLWKLYNPVLDYSSRFATHNMQVVNFVVQEPENDPRNFVYLWVFHDEESEENVASGCLYQLCFAKKDVYAGFGLFYDELESVCSRLEHKFTIDPYSKDASATWNSSLVTCFTIQNPLYTPPTTLSDSFEEGLFGNDQSLSVFVWRAEGKQGGGETKHWMAVFDLNRWYHAQMPQAIRCIGSSLQVCPFWAVYSLDEVVSLSPAHSLLNVEVSGDRVLRFINNSPLPPEEHSFPSALQLTNVRFITSGRIIQGRCDGWQGQLLNEFLENGVEYLVSPADFYYQCLRARLLPQSYLEEKVKGTEYQREVLLNMALEQGLACTLVSACIKKWADGELTEQGCTLTMLLSWAWHRVAAIKDSWHLACELLYDNLGHQIDARTDWQLKSLTSALTQLKKVFTILIAHTGPTTEKGQQELEVRLDTINILLTHFEIVRWCVSVNMLPELDCNSEEAAVSQLFVYPRNQLKEIYKRRRAELKDKKGIVDKLNLLLIDELVDCQGAAIKRLWETLDGDGFYPPDSLQGIVSMYLLEDITLELKHAITLYLLQDLAALAKTDASSSTMASFVERFLLSPSLVHQVQGFWFIDHKDYEEGVRHLVNPTVHEELCSNWKHISVVNTLLAQSQGLPATRFLHTKCVPINSQSEQRLYISVLVDNKQVNQALQYLRNSQSIKNFPDLMFHLLKECQKYKLIGQLLQHHLTEQEEYFLEQHLRKRGEAHALEPLFLYYLHHSRFLQAYQLNEDMNKMEKTETISGSYDKTITRNRLMEAYLRVLPDATKKLLLEKKHVVKPAVKRFECSRPKPLSTVVHSVDHTVMSRSNFVLALMEKVKEAKEMCHLAESQPEENALTQKVSANVTDVPLLGTPRRLAASLRASEIIYPELIQSPLPNNPLSVVKRKIENLENRSLHQVTVECLQLLQTPTRSQHRKSPSTFKGPLHIKTPQSILKVHSLRKSNLPTPAIESTRKSSGSLLKKFASSTLHLNTSPVEVEEIGLRDSLPITAPTPKQLRFVGVSPSPSPTAFGQTSLQESLRLRDTSVTPPIVEEGSETPPPDEMEILEDFHQHLTPDKTSIAVDGVDNPASSVLAAEVSVEESCKKNGLDIQDIEATSSSPSPVLSVDEHDVHSLVRPDLHPSWQNEDSLVAAQTEIIVDEEISFQISSAVSKKSDTHSTPAMMTSSPVDMMELAAPEISFVTANEEEEEQDQSHVWTHQIDYEKRLQRVGTVLKRTFTKTVVEKKSSVEEVNVNMATGVASEKELCVQILTVATEEHKAEESPPATPPLSKKAKLMARSKHDEEDHSSAQYPESRAQCPEGESRRRKTPERKSPSRTHEDVPREQVSPSRTLRSSADRRTSELSPARDMMQTPKRRSPSRRTKLFSNAEPEPSDPTLSARNRTKTPDGKSLVRNDEAFVEAHDSKTSSSKSPFINVRKSPSEKESDIGKSQTDPAKRAKRGQKSTGDHNQEEVTPDRTILRRSTRLRTPPRDSQHTESQSKVAIQTRSLRKLNAEKPEHVDSVSEQAEKSHSKSMETLDEEPLVRRTRGKSKTPDRVAVENDEPVTHGRSSRKRLKPSEHLVAGEIEQVILSIDRAVHNTLASNPILNEAPSGPIKSETLQPGSVSSEMPLTPTRKSRLRQSASREMQSDASGHVANKTLSNQQSPVRLERDLEEVKPSPSRKSKRMQKSPEKFPDTSKHMSPANRKSTRKLKSPEKLHTDQIEPIPLPISPNRSTSREKSEVHELSLAIDEMRKKRASSVDHEMPRRASLTRGRSAEPGTGGRCSRDRKTPDRTLQALGEDQLITFTPQSSALTIDEVREDQMPPLRLEIDEESNEEKKITKESKRTTERVDDNKENPIPEEENPLVQPALKNLGKELSPSFIFSPPLKHTLRKSEKRNSEPDTEKVEKHTFIFSHPTLAIEDEAQGNSSPQQEQYNQQAEPVKEKRKRRTLFDGSPILLSPALSPSTSPIGAQRHPTESQRMSAIILRRYKPRWPKTRRLKPSQAASRH